MEKVLHIRSNKTLDTYKKIPANIQETLDAHTNKTKKKGKKATNQADLGRSSQIRQIRPRSGRSGRDPVGQRLVVVELVAGGRPGGAARRRPSGWSGEVAALGWRGEAAASGWSGEAAVGWTGEVAASRWSGGVGTIGWGRMKHS
jgi:hypothetical protein